MKVKTNDKAGCPHASNRNETLGRDVVKAKGLKVKTNLKAGWRGLPNTSGGAVDAFIWYTPA